MAKDEIQKLPKQAKMPHHIKVLDLGNVNTDYTGWKVRAWVNPTFEKVADVSSGDIDRSSPVLGNEIIKQWNFVDGEGNELPPPSEETIRKLPMDILNAIVEAITNHMTTVSKN